MKTKLIILLSFFICKCIAQNWLPLGEGTNNGTVGGIELFSFEDKLFIGGEFTTVDNIPIPAVAYWNDKNWKSTNTSGLILRSINSFHTYKNELHSFGWITPSNGFQALLKYDKIENSWLVVPNSEVKRISDNGSLTFGRIYDAIEYNEELYVVGDFDFIGDSSVKNIAKWNGVEWTQVLDNNNNELNIGLGIKLIIYKNDLIICGDIHSINNVEYKDIAKWDGFNWENMNGGLIDNTPERDISILSLEVFNGKLYAGGLGSKIYENGKSYTLIRWNGSHWEGINGFEQNETNYNYSRISALKSFGNILFIAEGIEGQTIMYNEIEIKKMDEKLNRLIGHFEIYNNQLYAGGYFFGENIPNGIAKLGNLSIDGNLSENCTLFPNPSNGKLFFDYQLSQNSKTIIEVYDIYGRVLLQKYFDDLEGKYLKEFDLSNFHKGIYFFTITTKDFKETKSVVIN